MAMHFINFKDTTYFRMRPDISIRISYRKDVPIVFPCSGPGPLIIACQKLIGHINDRSWRNPLPRMDTTFDEDDSSTSSVGYFKASYFSTFKGNPSN